MKLSYNWLKKFVDFSLSPQELSKVLTSIGIETSVVSHGANWTSVITAKVLSKEKHPNADKLSLCLLTDGKNNYSVVCGAKNVDAGQIVPLAKIGAVLPGDFEIKKSKIRGVESEGMICSEKELGLKDSSEGILVLDEKTETGVPLENVLGDIDSVLEIEITTNRGDCLSHLGVAREIGAKLKKQVVLPVIKTPNSAQANNVTVESPLCSRYIGCLIKGVKAAPSPKWLADSLEKCGIRPINNIVDITNYVMLETGQPLHAFDITKLSSEKVIVRAAAKDEKITALDGKEYKLDADMLVIADEQKPVAIAGVMGGEYSGIDDKTETVFLESAIFAPSSIRKTSKKLNLSSDSSYRYERGVSWDISQYASWRAVNLILELAGGRLESRGDVRKVEYEKTNIILRIDRVSKLLGYNVDEKEITEILRYLGIDLEPKGEVILCTVPSWRNDIKEEVDLIEEVARIHGYENIPAVKEQDDAVFVKNNSFFPEIVAAFRSKLSGLGFSEALNYSFSEIKELELFDLKYSYKIANPISKENEVLRPSLLPSLYKNLSFNAGQGASRVALFEYGKIFTAKGERKTFGAVMYGSVWQEWWKWSENKINPSFDFYFGGGIVKNILPSEDFIISENLNPEGYYHPGKTAAVIYRGKPVAQFGILKPSVSADLKGEVFYFEFDIESVAGVYESSASLYKHFTKFPSVKRDISVTADKSLQFAKIEKTIKSIMKAGNILKDYSLFSVYEDAAKLGEGKISYSFRLSYKNDEKTLTDKEVNDDMNKLLEKLDGELSVKLRQ
ncbi:phenylalanine--tRNA ligase subunit beta [Endomicrobium proavitum]|uniref:Phenylalanine--tRNA ligase beta subunit n=1 Tax=Endomicrobium proavitum TaxID=1408281 RepID=A0A0G3WJC2_9BACT|nr:phenylalanine--tRNA ligase subunit beta [Endomicrobium proavitum]AKL97584.1 Phenylalanine--tRNA ligase beta subunit [Endomicrobium proavitum]